MLYPPTCVGLGYGRRAPSLGVFLGGMGSAASRKRFVSGLGFRARPDFPGRAAYALSRGRPEPRPRTLPRRPVGVIGRAAVQECPPVARRLRLPASP